MELWPRQAHKRAMGLKEHENEIHKRDSQMNTRIVHRASVRYLSKKSDDVQLAKKIKEFTYEKDDLAIAAYTALLAGKRQQDRSAGSVATSAGSSF